MKKLLKIIGVLVTIAGAIGLAYKAYMYFKQQAAGEGEKKTFVDLNPEAKGNLAAQYKAKNSVPSVSTTTSTPGIMSITNQAPPVATSLVPTGVVAPKPGLVPTTVKPGGNMYVPFKPKSTAGTIGLSILKMVTNK